VELIVSTASESAAPSQLQLWFARPEQFEQSPALVALLEPYELAAQARLIDPQKGHEYFVTRILARIALGSVMGASPASLRFERSPYGKPALEPPGEIQFNLSNTRGLVVCLIARVGGVSVGVDVEARTRGAKIIELAPTVFSTQEQADLWTQPSEKREHYATQLWTLKESYIKARGKGMALPLDGFTFRLQGATTLTLEPVMEDRAERWAFHTLQLGEHIVSCCVERSALTATPSLHDLGSHVAELLLVDRRCVGPLLAPS
jgi:4'-phosphopantetheinyl transferase